MERRHFVKGIALIPLSMSAVNHPLFAISLFGGKSKTIKPKNGMIHIPVNKISDGKAHYFTVLTKGDVKLTFFVVQSSDGVIRSAVDACDVCYKAGKGYKQDGDVMVCVNCGRRFPLSRINVVKGGCNPVPLDRTIKDENLVITMAVLNRNNKYGVFQRVR